MRRLGSIGASIFLIFLGVIAIIELVEFIITKDHASRSSYLSGLIFLVIFGLIYYVTFRLLGGWKPSTWDGTNSGLKTLLFIIGFPGLILGSVLLVIFIALEIDFSIDNTSAVGYSLSKKKKKVPTDTATPPTGEQQGQQGT